MIITNCNIKKNISHHGIHQLKEKNELLKIGKSNKNDIIDILGPPSVKSTFDNDLFFYIERKTITQGVIRLGQRKLLVNNVLVVELDNRGLLLDKSFYDLNEMNDVKFSSLETKSKYSKRAFVYDFLSSMRQKINDPLGKRKKPN